MASKSRSPLLYFLLCLSVILNVLFLLRSTPTSLKSSRKLEARDVSLNLLRGSTTETALANPFFLNPPGAVPMTGVVGLVANSSHAIASAGSLLSDAPQFSTTSSAGPKSVIRLSGYSQVAEIGPAEDSWSVFEDISQRDGDLVFQNSRTQERRVFPKRSEATFYTEDKKWKKYAGLSMATIGMDLRDLLADTLLKDGEPDEEAVRNTIPPINSQQPTSPPGTSAQWNTFVGNVEANDNVAIYGYGFTKSYHPKQYFPQIADNIQNSWEGLLGGYMPAVRKILSGDSKDESDYYEILVFGDTDVKDPFVVQTWHRTSHIRNGTIVSTTYGHSYPEFPSSRPQPNAEDFYKSLFRFTDYWQTRVSDMALLTVPDASWYDMTRHAFVKELLVRPGGSYPKYGAIDRDYYGSEYDGFQDIFTSSLSANLEWGRFAQAWAVIDNYMTLFVGNNGTINMRGPEIGQYGLTLSLLAKYVQYSGDTDLLLKHKEKIVGLAQLLVDLHEESLRLNASDTGHGLIHGWSESDASLTAQPNAYWKPYFANSAMAIRGFRDISQLDIFREHKEDWTRRASMLTNQTLEAVYQSIKVIKNAPYIPPLPGTNLTFRESMAREKPSPQDWPHRLYAELLHAAVLPPALTDLIHNTMRAYGATSMGVVANVGAPSADGRDILGFVSYGYALSLLLNNRIDEFVLFLYSHRYHAHTRGSWTAGEVTDITGGRALFCIPAQLTIPSIMRWALVLEHPDENVLYLGRGIPRAWLATAQEVGIRQAPTRWGRVDYIMQYLKDATPGSVPKLRAQAVFGSRVPGQVEIKLRMPTGVVLRNVTVNGRPAEIKNEAILVLMDGKEKTLDIEGL